MFPEKRVDIGACGLYTALREPVTASAATVQGGIHVFDGERLPVGADKRVDVAGIVVPGEGGGKSAAPPRHGIGQTPHTVRARRGAE